MKETGWLIELPRETTYWLYLTGATEIGWTIHPGEALRFARAQDAYNFMEFVGLTSPIVTEHVWG